jgi:hypothetical protein
MQRNVEIDRVDQPVRRPIVRKADRAALFGAHHPTSKDENAAMRAATKVPSAGGFHSMRQA